MCLNLNLCNVSSHIDEFYFSYLSSITHSLQTEEESL